MSITTNENTPWSWREKVLDFLKPESRLLQLFPENGKFLFSLGHDPARCTVLVKDKSRFPFAPGGVTLAEGEPEGPLPFPENSFDLVLADSVPCEYREVYRVLAPEGFFLTRQLGGGDSRTLRRLLGIGSRAADFNLENELPLLQKAGFRAMYRNQAYPLRRFCSLEELETFLAERQLTDPFCGLSSEQRREVELLFERQGFIENEEHLFLLIGKKKAG